MVEEYRQLQGRSYRRYLWRRLLGRPATLLNLAEAVDRRRVAHHESLGVQTVSLDRICGSEGRADDFDPDFRPLRVHTRERWVNIALVHVNGQPLPPAELIQVGESYFVRDGHHRISVARANGQLAIDALVTCLHLAPVQQPLAMLADHKPGRWRPWGEQIAATCAALLRSGRMICEPLLRSATQRAS
ncbi:MAG TPA: hypothetical protein PKE45_02295 [Caldilineaceae bacterium]|nr:hypothetical protein [Caldilineaceae bacterium]